MEELYEENVGLVYRFLLKNCHSEALAEELTQETFLQAVKNIHKYDHSCKISVWLCAIAKHLWFQYLRRHAKEIPTDIWQFEAERAKEPENLAIKKYELLDVLKDLQKLPQQMREVVYLRAMAELSFRDIGEIMGKSESWARVTFYRAKENLIRRREKYDER